MDPYQTELHVSEERFRRQCVEAARLKLDAVAHGVLKRDATLKLADPSQDKREKHWNLRWWSGADRR